MTLYPEDILDILDQAVNEMRLQAGFTLAKPVTHCNIEQAYEWPDECPHMIWPEIDLILDHLKRYPCR